MRTFPRGLKGSNPRGWFDDKRVNVPGLTEVIWEPLYHKQTVLAGAGTQNITFFQEQVGVNGNTLSDTNMDLQGQIPKGKSFIVTGVQVALYTRQDLNNNATASGVNDIYNVGSNGNLVFRIQSKDYIRQGPIGKFPAVERFYAEAEFGGEVNPANSTFSYMTPTGREFAIRDLLLESNQNFSITLNEVPSTSFDMDIMVTLNGFLGRNAQ